MSTSVTNVVSHFPSPQNVFTTTTSGSVSSGATSVGLSSVTGYSNGQVAVFIIDPANSKKQSFTGVIDTNGVQVTNVIWTDGTNVGHDAGATVVDYADATHIGMMSKGVLVEHNQDGTHDESVIISRTEDSSPASADFVMTSDTSAAGVLKKAQLGNLTPFKLDKSVLTTDSNPYKFSVYRNSAWNTPNATEGKVQFDSETFDTNSNFDSSTNYRYAAPVDGFYFFHAQVGFSSSVVNAYAAIYKNGSLVRRGSQIVATNILGSTISAFLQLSATDYIEIYLFTSAVQTGSTGADDTWFEGYLVSRT